ncbi:hypothetical protein COLAER_01186 [Collinsella aerofaciens ATCC 25986]|uniref:Uncharacterized protein n=1 Tax=Collinsella aerofaciens (strain ATCC 25986 / DSM 3979 / JCM 10188 / KCTC 3647 / NCTC 11838 / VPI 1003) TaxID=411903 RepID=A4E9T2_COLAA|nr:hypothetical protein COLAER_01186 [Collinsella aerofaciens ATCC 25986]
MHTGHVANKVVLSHSIFSLKEIDGFRGAKLWRQGPLDNYPTCRYKPSA